MWPALVPGKRYLATNLLRPKAGDMIVFRNQNSPKGVFVKRVKAVHSEGYEVESLVSWGSSGEDIGMIDYQHILGKLFRVLK